MLLGFYDRKFPDFESEEGKTEYVVNDDALTCLSMIDELASKDSEVYFPENFYDGSNIQGRINHNLQADNVPEEFASGIISNLKKIENFRPAAVGYEAGRENSEDSHIAGEAEQRDCIVVTYDTDFLDEERILYLTPVQMRGLVK